MLSYTGLSQGLWGEAMLTACYLLNRGYRAVVRLPDLKLKTSGERGVECIFVRYAEHSKAFRFFVIEPNDSVAINSIIESRHAILDENKFFLVLRSSLRIPNGAEHIGGLVVPEEVTKEVVQQPEPVLRKCKRNRNPKNFRPEFRLYLIEGTRDEISEQHSYCFNVADDPKTFDEAIKSQDVTFWKEVTNDEMDPIMGNNTWVLADLRPAFLNGDLEEERQLVESSMRFSLSASVTPSPFNPDIVSSKSDVVPTSHERTTSRSLQARPASTTTPSSFTYNMIATLIPLCNNQNARRAIQPTANGHFSAHAVARYYAALVDLTFLSKEIFTSSKAKLHDAFLGSGDYKDLIF
nr:zinc finger, CCHC-type [Tanacetum cinerariifolium]